MSWLSSPPASLELAIAGRRKAKKEISKKSLVQTWFSRNQYRALSCEIVKPLSQFALISRQGRLVNPVLQMHLISITCGKLNEAPRSPDGGISAALRQAAGYSGEGE
jgi:hypothetical protein